jgi:hypothetical protein
MGLGDLQLCFTARQRAGVPARNWLLVPLPLKEFLSSNHLRIASIPNVEPRSLLGIVRRSPVFRDNALQIQLASLVEEGNSRFFYVLGRDDRRYTGRDTP